MVTPWEKLLRIRRFCVELTVKREKESDMLNILCFTSDFH